MSDNDRLLAIVSITVAIIAGIISDAQRDCPANGAGAWRGCATAQP